MTAAAVAPRPTAVDDARRAGAPASIDLVIYLLILGVGALPVALVQRGADYYTGDTIYFELARSIVRTGSYGFNFGPETMLPPGFPVILAVLSALLGSSHEMLVRTMPIFAVLGIIATYELLRREHGRGVAAAIGLLLSSSPILFKFSTTLVFSDLPYFCTSMLGLLLAARLDAAKHRWAVLAAACGLLLVASLLIRSSGIALFGGLFAWLIVSAFVDRSKARIRLKKFAAVLIAGLLTQGLLTQWDRHREPLPEWPIPGYPESYLSQLTIKSGNNPELGTVSLANVPARIARNAIDRSDELIELVSRKGCCRERRWFAPWVIAPILLVLVGLGTSVWKDGGHLYDWYFVGHETIYLLWPWDFETRFFLPVAPLACLYLWRGGVALMEWAAQKPRAAAACGLATAAVCGTSALASGSGDVRIKLGVLIWTIFAAAAAAIWYGDRATTSVQRSLQAAAAWDRRGTVLRAAAASSAIALIAIGLVMEIRIGLDNVAFDVTRDPHYPQIEAAKWLKLHTPEDSVAMARQVDVVYHYAGRKVVWFPPTSNLSMLMDGITKYHVQYVVVQDAEGENSYWQPPEQDTFDRLLTAQPGRFQLVQHVARGRVFEVVPQVDGSCAEAISSTSRRTELARSWCE